VGKVKAKSMIFHSFCWLFWVFRPKSQVFVRFSTIPAHFTPKLGAPGFPVLETWDTSRPRSPADVLKAKS
jgi:hypothetical protein